MLKSILILWILIKLNAPWRCHILYTIDLLGQIAVALLNILNPKTPT